MTIRPTVYNTANTHQVSPLPFGTLLTSVVMSYIWKCYQRENLKSLHRKIGMAV